MGTSGVGLAEYARSKKGTPYFYGSKMKILTETFMSSMHAQYPKVVTVAYIALARAKKQVGKVNVDCSGLISAYTEKTLAAPSYTLRPTLDCPLSHGRIGHQEL